MSAATEYCDREIAKCQDWISVRPKSEEWRMNQLVKSWQRTKLQLQKREALNQQMYPHLYQCVDTKDSK